MDDLLDGFDWSSLLGQSGDSGAGFSPGAIGSDPAIPYPASAGGNATNPGWQNNMMGVSPTPQSSGGGASNPSLGGGAAPAGAVPASGGASPAPQYASTTPTGAAIGNAIKPQISC